MADFAMDIIPAGTAAGPYSFRRNWFTDKLKIFGGKFDVGRLVH